MKLHAFWLTESYVLAFWAETDEVNTPSAAGDEGPPWHPYALSFDELEERLPEALDVFEDDVKALLPGAAEQADDASTPTLYPSSPEIPPEAALVPVRIPVACAIAEDVFDFLDEAEPETSAPGEGLEWSVSLLYWHRVAELARRLVDRNCYAPGLVSLEERWYPFWQAAFTRAEEPVWRQFEHRLPPICLANHLVAPANPQSLTEPRDLVLSFLDAGIDSRVRRRLLRRNTRRMKFKRGSGPPYRQWLNALKAGRLVHLDGTKRELAQFAEDVRAWNQYMRLPCLDTPYRMAFQLAAPESEDGDWVVHFALQAARDSSLILRAHRLWSSTPDELNASLASARHILLAGLGRGLDVFPQIRHALESAQPESCVLDKYEAIEFMTRTAPLLRRQGLHVILPPWWEDADDSLHMTLRLEPSTGERGDQAPTLGVDQLVTYRWELALGEQALSHEEFETLSRSKEPLVHRNGRWYRLDAATLRQSAELLERRDVSGQTTLAKAMKLGLEMEKSGVIPVIDFHGESDPVALMRDLAPELSYEPLPPPPELHGKLRAYQVNGFSWLVFVRDLGFGACLADDMGLGKTIQMIAVILQEHRQNPTTAENPSLIITPMSVVGNWVKELSRFAPHLDVMVHHGTDRETREEFEAAANAHDIVITTYALAVRDQASLLRCHWQNLILDEAQNIKNPSTKQALSIRSLRAHHRFCLTGTPIENRLTELWSIMEFLNPGYLGKLTSFRANFSVPIERNRDRYRADVLQKLIRPFVLRRLKSDQDIIRDLPDKQEMKVFCNLTAEQAALYQAVVDNMLATIDEQPGIGRRGLVLSTLVKLKQITNHPLHFLRDDSRFRVSRSGKLQRLVEMLEVLLEENDRALVFTQFSEFGELLSKKLTEKFGVEILYMHGGTPQTRRDEMVARFQSPKGPPIFVLSLKAGGVGLNLTAACHVFHFDRWWNPAVEDQATDRAFRIGQTRNVQVHKMVCVGTVEERIDQMLEEKKQLADQIVTPGETMLTELSSDELRDIFTLSRDAVVE